MEPAAALLTSSLQRLKRGLRGPAPETADQRRAVRQGALDCSALRALAPSTAASSAAAASAARQGAAAGAVSGGWSVRQRGGRRDGLQQIDVHVFGSRGELAGEAEVGNSHLWWRRGCARARLSLSQRCSARAAAVAGQIMPMRSRRVATPASRPPRAPA
jgi:hypothetical protein